MLTVVDRVRADVAAVFPRRATVGYRSVGVRSGSGLRPGSCGCARPLIGDGGGGWRHLSDGTVCAAPADAAPMVVG